MKIEEEGIMTEAGREGMKSLERGEDRPLQIDLGVRFINEGRSRKEEVSFQMSLQMEFPTLLRQQKTSSFSTFKKIQLLITK